MCDLKARTVAIHEKENSLAKNSGENP